MKKKMMLLVLMVVLVFSVPVYALDFDFEGNLTYHNDVLSWEVTTGATTVTVFTSSWDDGNFDPMLGVWDTEGNKLNHQDDGGVIGSTYSNGVLYTHGNWDTYYSLDLGAGTYILTLATYANFPNDDTLGEGFAYDGQTPIPIASWDQPANPTGHDGSFYSVHFLNALEVDPGNGSQVPEPSTMLLLGFGLLGLAGLRKKA